MTWKKLDDVVTGADQPMDAFALIGMEANANAACVDRPSSCGFAWPVDKRPVLACVQTVGIVLARWRLTPRFDSVDVRIHHFVRDAPINMGLTILTDNGPRDLSMPVQVAIGTQVTTLTVSGLRQYWGETVTLLLVVRSEIGESAVVYTGFARKFWNSINFGPGHGIVLDPAKRYTMDFINDPAGLGAEDGDSLPLPVTLHWWRTTPAGNLYTYIWPMGAGIGPMWDQSLIFNLSELGQSEMFGYSIRESGAVEYPPITGALRPGRPPAARHLGSLYGRNRQTFQSQARILHAGPVWDPQDTDLSGGQRCLWGPSVAHEISPAPPDWRPIGSTLVGEYDHSVQDPAGAAIQQYRSRIVVEGYLLAVYGSAENQLDLLVDVRLRLASFSGGAWSSDQVISDTLSDLHIRARQRLIDSETMDLTSEIWSFQQQDPALHHSYLRWAFPITDLRSTGRGGLTPFRIEITDTEIAATDRLLFLEIRGHALTATEDPVRATEASRPWYFCPTFTARIADDLGVTGGGDGDGDGDAISQRMEAAGHHTSRRDACVMWYCVGGVG